MMKPIALLVALSAVAGCDLYFGGHDNDHWNYCGSDGYYECSGNDCTWASSTCPAGAPSGAPTGYDCKSNADCAAGCYCANGTCEEAGFCTTDSDCGTGYVCDTMRSSCVPAPQPSCTVDTDCANGSVCTNGSCTATCTCYDDAGAAAQGYAYCDEARVTCMNGTDPAGTCGGEPTCNQIPPTCASGDVPLLGSDGCWNGQCEAAGQCAVPPSCSHINDSTNCLGRADCLPVYSGLNCTKPDGSACNDGDLNCTCTQFVFASCRNRTASP